MTEDDYLALNEYRMEKDSDGLVSHEDLRKSLGLTLIENPIQHDSKVVEGYNEKLFRIRVGDYRILYEVNYKNNQLGIVKIDKRSKVFSN